MSKKKSNALTRSNTALAPLTLEQALAEVPAMLDAIPGVDEDPTPRMAARILAAADPTDWESIFDGKSIKENAGVKVRFVALRQLPSDFEGPIKRYLVADIINLETGEADVMSISSTMSILQLLVAHKRGWLPLDAEVVRKAKPTKRGFYPIHLRALEPAKSVEQAS